MQGLTESFVFIAGAPRCGTTTMARLLRAHPQVCFSLVKEPHFFSQQDLRPLSDDQLRERVERDYLERFFALDAPDRQIRAEASVTYLYTPEQMEAALRLWPRSRFIIGIRDPMTMLPSLHQRLIYLGDETITRFDEAWAAIPVRAAGQRIPGSCIDPRWLRYDEAGRLATYLERFFATVGPESCLVVVFEDWVQDPKREYRRILDFIGLDPVDPAEIPVARKSRGVRYPSLQRLLKRPPRPLRPYLMSDRRRRRPPRAGTHPTRLRSLRMRLLKWNAIDPPKRAIPLGTQREIRRHLKGEVERLGLLIGRDLGHWLQVRDGSSKLASP